MIRLFIFLTTMTFSGLLTAQTYEWAKALQSTGSSYGKKVHTNPDGSSWVVGTFSQTLTLGSISLTASGGNNALVTRADSLGNFLWANKITGTAIVEDVTADLNGNAYVVGTAWSFPVSFGSITLTSGVAPTMFVAKYNSTGGVVSVYTQEKMEGQTIDANQSNQLFAGGKFTGTIQLSGVNTVSSENGALTSLLITSFDSQVNPVWHKQIDISSLAMNPSHYLIMDDLDSDDSGNVYITGEWANSVLHMGTNSYTNSQDSSDIFLSRFDASGNHQWTVTGTGQGHQWPQAISVSQGNHVFWSGWFTNVTDFGGGNVITPANAYPQLFVVKYDTLGNLSWVFDTPGSGLQSARGLVATHAGEVIVGGGFTGTINIGSQTFTSAGAFAYDLMAFKCDPAGNVLWATRANGASGNLVEEIYGMGADAWGNIYFTGTMGTGTTFGTITPQTGSNQTHAMLVKMYDTTFVFPPDSVWPGDANYDLVADNYDLLSIGIGYGAAGPARPNASVAWTAQPTFNWSQSLSTGVNYKHLDTNGDGVVDAADTLAISLNYGLTHNKTDHAEGSTGVPLFFEFAEDSIMAGDTVNVLINLGTDTLPASMIYGLAFSVNIDSSLVDPNSVKVSYNNSWLGVAGLDMLTLDRNFPLDGRLDIGMTRTDHQDETGYGEIARLSIIMVDDLTAKTLLSEVLKISFGNVLVISSDESAVPITTRSDSIVVYQDDGQNTAVDPALHASVKIYPNPAHNEITIEMDKIQGLGWKITSLMGQEIRSEETKFWKEKIAVNDLPAGVYFLTLKTSRGDMVRKILVK
ncbi:MAG: T9SS type A sorting domain-containing protein [Bacteroidia bacterium]